MTGKAYNMYPIDIRGGGGGATQGAWVLGIGGVYMCVSWSVGKTRTPAASCSDWGIGTHQEILRGVGGY